MKAAKTHNQSFVNLFLLVLVLLLSSCKHNPTGPVDDRPLITSSKYRNVILTLTDYDVLHITHQAGLDLRFSNVSRIGIGTKDSTTFKELQSIPSTYDPNTYEFIIHFDCTVTMDQSKIQEPLTIRYYATDSTYTDVDTTVDLYKFPYQSAQVFVTCVILLNSYEFQDIERIGGKFYFHVYGPNGLYEYDLNTRQTKLLYGYTSGDHIAADSSCVYCDVNHDRVDRYNVPSGTVDKAFLSFAPSSIYGMAIYCQCLFIFVGNSASTMSLKKFTLDGIQIDSLPYAGGAYSMTIYDSVVYSIDWWNSAADHITRFDLRTKTFLPTLLAPAKSCDGIKVYGDQLYFCDFNKDYVGTMPIADLVPVQITLTHMAHSRDYYRVHNHFKKSRRL